MRILNLTPFMVYNELNIVMLVLYFLLISRCYYSFTFYNAVHGIRMWLDHCGQLKVKNQ